MRFRQNVELDLQQRSYSAIAHWSTPDLDSVGFECGSRGDGLIRPSDGRFLYPIALGSPRSDHIRIYHRDCSPQTPGNCSDPYPTGVLANDPIAPSPACPDAAVSFWIRPNGDMLYRCLGVPDENIYGPSGGVELTLPNGLTLIAIAENDVMLLEGYFSGELWSGTSSSSTVRVAGVTGTIAGRAARLAPDGMSFLVALIDDQQPPATTAWSIDLMGQATMIGVYPAMPAGLSNFGSDGRLSATAELFEINRDGRDDVIVRRIPNGAATVVYTEATNPKVKLHISSLFTGP